MIYITKETPDHEIDEYYQQFQFFIPVSLNFFKDLVRHQVNNDDCCFLIDEEAIDEIKQLQKQIEELKHKFHMKLIKQRIF